MRGGGGTRQSNMNMNMTDGLGPNHQRPQHNSGRVSVVGHSLGSVILFDLLAHQRGHGDDRVFSPLVRT